MGKVIVVTAIRPWRAANVLRPATALSKPEQLGAVSLLQILNPDGEPIGLADAHLTGNFKTKGQVAPHVLADCFAV
jgi:hypothetical protein